MHREAVGRPQGFSGLTEPRFLAPALDAFVRGLPRTFRNVDAPDGTLVAFTITGPAGGRWALRREEGVFRLYADVALPAAAEVVLDSDAAWRLFTKGLRRGEAEARATLEGDTALARRALETVSVIG